MEVDILIVLTKDNNREIYNKLKSEIIENISSRKDPVTISLNGKAITLTKVFWLYNTLLLTMVEDFTEVNEKDLLDNIFNTKLFEKFVNKFLTPRNKHVIIDILTEFSKLSVIGNNKLDVGLSLHNIIAGYNKYPDFKAIIDGTDLDGNPLLKGDENIYEVEDKFATGIANMRKVLEDKEDLWFYDFVKNGEGLNFKQLFQTIGFVGSKPVVNYDFRNNGVNTEFIKSNFLKGMATVDEYFINATSARKAQVVNRMLIQPSGYFMRRLSLLTIDTVHNVDEDDCGTEETIKYNIKTTKQLGMVDGRSYMEEGQEKVLDADKDIHLVGTTINLRSPITCKHTHTTGVCKACFGRELSEKLRYFNSGMLGVLNLTETFTQNMLNAKHFSSTNASRIEFDKQFYSIFEEEDVNYFSLKDDVKILSVTNYEIDYSPEYDNESEEDDIKITESVKLTGLSTSKDKFSVIEYETNGKTGSYILDHDLYLVLDREVKTDYSNEDRDFIDLSEYEVNTAFYIIQNNELATGMNKILAVIDNNDYIKTLNDSMALNESDKASKLLEKFNDLLVYYNLDFIKSWNVEMIMSNLFFDLNRKHFDFSDKTKAMEIYPVPKALREHRSLSVSLSYERLRDQFSDPHTFTKDSESKLDAWFK